MSKFSGKSLNELKKAELGLTAYKQGIQDFFDIFFDTYTKTIEFYGEELRLCKNEIKKLEVVNEAN